MTKEKGSARGRRGNVKRYFSRATPTALTHISAHTSVRAVECEVSPARWNRDKSKVYKNRVTRASVNTGGLRTPRDYRPAARNAPSSDRLRRCVRPSRKSRELPRSFSESFRALALRSSMQNNVCSVSLSLASSEAWKS